MDEVWWLSDQDMYALKGLVFAMVVDRIIAFELPLGQRGGLFASSCT